MNNVINLERENIHAEISIPSHLYESSNFNFYSSSNRCIHNSKIKHTSSAIGDNL